MNTHQLMTLSGSESSSSDGRVTRGMIRERAFELAVMSGHAPQDASIAEWEQAKLDLMNPDTGLWATADMDGEDDSMFDHLNQEPAPRA